MLEFRSSCVHDKSSPSQRIFVPSGAFPGSECDRPSLSSFRRRCRVGDDETAPWHKGQENREGRKKQWVGRYQCLPASHQILVVALSDGGGLATRGIARSGGAHGQSQRQNDQGRIGQPTELMY